MTEPDPAASSSKPANTFGGWMGSMWLYTTLRFGMFFALWGLLVLIGLHGFFAPLLALLLSVPLSFVLLARPRAQFTRRLEARVDAQRVAREQLNAQLDPDAGKDTP
jgi:hypothetical protein